MIRLLAFGVWAVASVASAQGNDLDLEWLAPAQVCPDREELRRGLSRRLQREVSLGSDAPIALHGEVVVEGEGYVLTLRARAEQGEGDERRVMRARTCNELARASVLFASLLFSRQAPVAPQDTQQPSAAVRLYARAQLVADLGTMPAVALGPGAMVGLAFDPVLVELGGFAFLSQDAARSSLQLTAAAAVGCVRVLRFASVSPCLHLEVGSLHAEGRFASAVSKNKLWLMAGAGVRAGLALTSWLYWLSEVSAGMPWDRAQFVVGGVGEVHSIPSVVGRLTTGLEGRF